MTPTEQKKGNEFAFRVTFTGNDSAGRNKHVV
jgi:hypothetical protein